MAKASFITRRNVLALASTVILTSACRLMAQQNKERNYYYLNFRTRGGWYIARINGITFSNRATVDLAEFIVPINPYLKSGENILEFIFVPTWKENDVEWPIGSANPAFAMRATLRQLNLKTRAEEEFGLANINFDMETGTLRENDHTELGATLSAGRPDFGRTGAIEFAPGTYTDVYGPPLDARVVKIRFTIPDALPPFPWADAKPLQDTERTRTDLAAAYQEVHTALQASNFERIFELYRPAWERSSVTLAYEDAQDFVNVNDVQTSLARVNKQGGVLGPLTFNPNLHGVRMDLMDGGRLVRFDPAPIFWTSPEDTSQRQTSTMISFFKDDDGKFKIGLVLYAF